MRKLKIVLSAFVLLAGVTFAVGSANAATLSPGLTPLQLQSQSQASPVHCRRYYHCHRHCRWTRWGKRCWRSCHRCW